MKIPSSPWCDCVGEPRTTTTCVWPHNSECWLTPWSTATRPLPPIGEGGEKPGPRRFPPMAALMAAGARCLLVMVEMRIQPRGGVIAQRETDGVLIVSSPHGGEIRLNDGTRRRVLSWDECDEILSAFDSLSPFGDGEGFWVIYREFEGEPLRGVVWGAKKHALFVTEPRLRIIKASETRHRGLCVSTRYFWIYRRWSSPLDQ